MFLSTINNIIPNTHRTNNFQSWLTSRIQDFLIHAIDWTKSEMQYRKWCSLWLRILECNLAHQRYILVVISIAYPVKSIPCFPGSLANKSCRVCGLLVGMISISQPFNFSIAHAGNGSRSIIEIKTLGRNIFPNPYNLPWRI